MESSINFPSSRGEPSSSGPQLGPAARRPPHLPFRRISMPSVPSSAALTQIRAMNIASAKDNRVSVVSQQSFDSLSENQRGSENVHYIPNSPGAIASPKPRRTRPSSLQPPPKVTAPVPGTVIKRRKVLRELLDTERTYVDGLEFINEHFLSPLIKASMEGKPLISPGQMSSIFSNFVDMLGFHQSFYATLSSVVGPHVPATQPPSAYNMASPTRGVFGNASTNIEAPPAVAALLAQHVPFFSMYTPFVTAYPTIMASLHNLTSPHSSSYSAPFAVWLKEREQDPRCGRLGLRDWLLTLVQRCPRYLLLVRDLANYTEPTDPEYSELEEVIKMLERINTSLNTALQTQSITLQLLTVQKATPNLPIPFLEPGRTFIRRGSLFQVADRVERLREFFLFSDCFVWLSKGGEREGAVTAKEEQMRQSIVSSPSNASFAALKRGPSELEPPLRRAPSSAYGSKFPTQVEEEKWWFRGKINLLDLDIVLPVAAFGEEGKIEVHSPQMSFSLFCDSAEEREAWASAIRGAKQTRLVAMNSTNPNSTLTSSSSNQHLRLALQALPYAPDPVDSPTTPHKKKGSKKDKTALKDKQRRGHVEHFVPAIWVPDSKAEACMRCGGVFSWRRRRHHCRLCGKCVCANCSGKTFFIASKNPTKESTKPARACNACYEAVFPVLDPETPEDTDPTTLPHYSSIGTLTALPFSKSTPSLTLDQVTTPPIARPSPLHYELPTPVRRQSNAEGDRPKSGLDFLPISRPPVSGSRPGSEIRSSSYTTSTTASSMPPFDVYKNASSATMGMSESPSSSISPLGSESPIRPRPRASFSAAAIAVHTTPVTARASIEVSRYSLVLGGRSRVGEGTPENEGKEGRAHNGRKSLDAGYAVGKLADILGRK
ncbi:hypothetical protein M408DRAFT_327129 [Serendipita vermifera MAFF 305830]|uniref:FYVE-type domain-containing protein n=1 Tax=Serendipita vermifera MAFF 305830 TaxID=933852 RepID=A0A0C3B4B2_SERVB|nr:hypothetical protein M408DRAFT_327129 [Serendipita vermifera MAFF 305830]